MGNSTALPDTILDQLSSSISQISHCRIVVVGPKSGDDCLTELCHLPQQAKILATGSNIEEIRQFPDYAEANVILNVNGNAATLGPIIDEMPFLEWIHSLTAGVDHILCPEITNDESIVLTNAKGIFSSTLAEYVIGSCLYFTKSFPRLIENRKNRNWDRFNMIELRGMTMGIVGYGDIGRACATLAKAFGMKVIATRRRLELNIPQDSRVDQFLPIQSLNELMQTSDFVVVAVALTPETRGLINASTLKYSKKNQVLINIARGPVVDEAALEEALSSGTLLGAALDVFTVEPLPISSKLWNLPNVLLSPHNADMTADFRHQSVRFFTENCAKFVRGDELDNIVDLSAGY